MLPKNVTADSECNSPSSPSPASTDHLAPSPVAAVDQPAKRGGANHVSHGMRAHRWPKGCQRPANRVNRFGKFLESSVVKQKGELSVEDASAIDVAVRWQKHCELAQRWLAIEYDSLTPDQRLHFSRETAKAAEARDRAVRLLGLGKAIDRWNELEVDQGAENAPGGQPEARGSDLRRQRQEIIHHPEVLREWRDQVS